MNRIFYFLSMFGLNIAATELSRVHVSPDIGLFAIAVIGALAVVASCARWENMGYHPGWGLLVFFPFVPIYGFIMPKDMKTNGIDTIGKILSLTVLIVVIAIMIAMFVSP